MPPQVAREAEIARAAAEVRVHHLIAWHGSHVVSTTVLQAKVRDTQDIRSENEELLAKLDDAEVHTQPTHYACTKHASCCRVESLRASRSALRSAEC